MEVIKIKSVIKKILGYSIMFLALPIFFGLCTWNGQFCYHGSCEDVMPFWGGVAYGFLMDIFFVSIILLIKLVLYLIY